MIRAAFNQLARLVREWHARRQWDAVHPSVWRF